MVKSAFSLLSSFHAPERGDFTDFVIGNILSNVLLILAVITSFIQYMWRPISCSAPATFTNSMEQYAENYCQGLQTYFLPLYLIPNDGNERKSAVINHSAWLPIVLLAHSLLLKLPKLVWIFLSKFSSVSLTSLIKAAESYPNLDATGRQSAVKTAADYLNSRFTLRDPDSRRTKLATIRDYWQCLKHPFPTGILALAAITTKLMYAVTTTVAFVKLCQYLQVDNASTFGWKQLNAYYSGEKMQDIMVFPEVILCDYEVRVLGNIHHHTIQCVLPLNRFYSTLVLLLWYAYYLAEGLSWISFMHTLFSTLLPWPRKWFVVRALHRRRTALIHQIDPIPPANGHHVTRRSSSATAPVNQQLLQQGLISPVELRQFLETHLRTDGYFVLKYVSERGDDLFVYELINYLWRQFVSAAVPGGSIYEPSAEPSPATRHRYLVDPNVHLTPPSVEISRKLVPASIPSIPTSMQQQQMGFATVPRYENRGQLVEHDDSKRPLLEHRNEEKRYWDTVETTKM